ncbi:MAG: prepilin-type N-terminal cleavage/methylation domain-containing protein [Pseudomonadota bacterium]|nr:prepilin-type N-terminal cleavage/methylation domain-containing protein [Pseudomonadota bacterium]
MIKRPETGFTLLEMVAALTVLGLLAAIVGPILTNGVRAYNDSASAVHTLSKLRVASERLVREVREIRRDGSGNFDISLPLSSTTLQFFKTDTDQVTISSAVPLITLAYTGIGGAPVLSDEVSALSFSYFQADGSLPANDNSDVAFIEFELVLTHAGNNYAQRSRIALRNQP